MKSAKRAVAVVASATLLVACSSSARGQEADPEPLDQLPPAGFGTLGQDDISVRLQTPILMIQMMPLDERVIRLLSPDTYRSLHRLLERNAADIETARRNRGISRPTVFLVTFFGLQERAQFREEEITINSRNRFFRPEAIVPLSATWNQQELGQRQTARAIYLFNEGIPFLEPFEVSYLGSTLGRWGENKIQNLEQEMARVVGRASGGAPPN